MSTHEHSKWLATWGTKTINADGTPVAIHHRTAHFFQDGKPVCASTLSLAPDVLEIFLTQGWGDTMPLDHICGVCRKKIMFQGQCACVACEERR